MPNDKLDIILAEYRRGLDPVFAKEEAAWKAVANRDKKISATDYAIAALNSYFLSQALEIVDEIMTGTNRNDLRLELRKAFKAKYAPKEGQ